MGKSRRKGTKPRTTGTTVRDLRHPREKRPNNPPAGLAPAFESTRERRVTRYQYDPHLDPQLVWAAKAKHTSFEVDVVPLHVHERVSTRAILDAARRPEPLELELFGETPLPADQRIQFYQHEVGWTNRLILGDSLLVMNSLLVKEGMADKVQMIYIDPPYGIKYSSNFQPRIDRRDVKDKDEDLTHEPEQMKAYRDTWRLGIHSYLTFLRTAQAIPVPAVEDPTQAPIPQFEEDEAQERVSDRSGDYLTMMIRLLQQQGGVLFPGGKKLDLQSIRSLNLGYLHAEAEAKQNGNALRVAISFGPQHGPVSPHQVQEAIPTAKMNGYHLLVFAGFAFDPEAQALIQKAPVEGLQIHFANIAPDVLVGDLLKTTRASQIFTVFGQPDVALKRKTRGGKWLPLGSKESEAALRKNAFAEDSEWQVELRGVDVHDPPTDEVDSTRGRDVVAWFLDADRDGMSFRTSQASFPGDSSVGEGAAGLQGRHPPDAFREIPASDLYPLRTCQARPSRGKPGTPPPQANSGHCSGYGGTSDDFETLAASFPCVGRQVSR